ncbi:MAG: hypothetical protein NC548_15570 [Lachnospiraceae bacterium]|nr:hypothetical protein [Lachnospiraceae bacterium]
MIQPQLAVVVGGYYVFYDLDEEKEAMVHKADVARQPIYVKGENNGKEAVFKFINKIIYDKGYKRYVFEQMKTPPETYEGALTVTVEEDFSVFAPKPSKYEKNIQLITRPFHPNTDGRPNNDI